jgi:hypothetical protein
MMKKVSVFVGMVLVCFLLSVARAEEHFGIPLYPGAKPDAASANYCRTVDPSGKFALCFRTSDSFEKVSAFYKNQPNLKKGMALNSGGFNSAIFCPKGQEQCPDLMKGVDVSLNTPWSANMKMPPNAKAADFENKDVRIRIWNREAQMKGFNQRQSK